MKTNLCTIFLQNESYDTVGGLNLILTSYFIGATTCLCVLGTATLFIKQIFSYIDKNHMTGSSKVYCLVFPAFFIINEKFRQGYLSKKANQTLRNYYLQTQETSPKNSGSAANPGLPKPEKI